LPQREQHRRGRWHAHAHAFDPFLQPIFLLLRHWPTQHFVERGPYRSKHYTGLSVNAAMSSTAVEGVFFGERLQPKINVFFVTVGEETFRQSRRQSLPPATPSLSHVLHALEPQVLRYTTPLSHTHHGACYPMSHVSNLSREELERRDVCSSTSNSS